MSGTRNDACLYVGQDESIKVHDNVATDCIIGFEIENSHHVRMVANRSMNNTAGMLIDIVGNREVDTISDDLVAHNTFGHHECGGPGPQANSRYDLRRVLVGRRRIRPVVVLGEGEGRLGQSHPGSLCPECSRTSLWSVAPAGERPVFSRLVRL